MGVKHLCEVHRVEVEEKERTSAASVFAGLVHSLVVVPVCLYVLFIHPPAKFQDVSASWQAFPELQYLVLWSVAFFLYDLCVSAYMHDVAMFVHAVMSLCGAINCFMSPRMWNMWCWLMGLMEISTLFLAPRNIMQGLELRSHYPQAFLILNALFCVS